MDVVDEGERVAHLLAEPIRADGRVQGEVDWQRRYDYMQQHTAQHLLSAVLADRLGCATVSVHFGDATSTLDLDTPVLDPGRLEEVETRANAMVWEQRPVAVSFEDAATTAGLRKPTDRTGTIRVVSIAGVDRSACGGTHVRSTGEVGAVHIGKIEKKGRENRRFRLRFGPLPEG